MASFESTARFSPNGSKSGSSVRSGLELFCLSFVALFLELMVIRWAPAVVRLVAYYANLMLISSFLGLGAGAIVGKTRRSLFRWLPALLLINVGFLLIAHYVTLPSTAAESRFYASVPRLWNYLSLVGIFVSNAIVFVPLGQRIGSLFDALPALRAYSWDLGGSLAGTLAFGLFSLKYFSPTLGMGFVILMIALLLPRRQWVWAVPLLGLVMAGVFLSTNSNAFWSPYYYIAVVENGSPQKGYLREPPPGLRTMEDPPHYSVSVNHDFYQPERTLDPTRYSPQKKAEVLDGRRPTICPTCWLPPTAAYSCWARAEARTPKLPF